MAAIKDSQYKDPIIEAVINFLDGNASRDIKTYYYGDVLLIPKTELPAISVAIDATRIAVDDTGTDKSTVPLVISVITDINDNPNRDFDVMAGTNSLYDIVIGRNDDFTFKDYSLAHLLRKNQDLAAVTLPGGDSVQVWLGTETDREPLDIDFGIGVERRGQGIWSVESTIRINAYAYTPREDDDDE